MTSSQKFLLENINRDQVLISRNEYRKLMNKLTKESLSPFILEEIENEKKKEIEEKKNIEMERLKSEVDKNQKDIYEMIQNINWEIKNEFPKKSLINKSEISLINITIESFENDIKMFNVNKDKCNWILDMKSDS